MIESYKQAIEEFKRVDHLFYVTLKYTRTVDVIRSVIDRIISTFEHGNDAVLKCLLEEKKIEEIPNNPVGKGLLVKASCKETEKYIDMYLHLRKIMRDPYTKREEFRRHVTMIVQAEEGALNIDIDLLKERYDETKEFLTYIKGRVQKYIHDTDN